MRQMIGKQHAAIFVMGCVLLTGACAGEPDPAEAIRTNAPALVGDTFDNISMRNQATGKCITSLGNGLMVQQACPLAGSTTRLRTKAFTFEVKSEQWEAGPDGGGSRGDMHVYYTIKNAASGNCMYAYEVKIYPAQPWLNPRILLETGCPSSSTPDSFLWRYEDGYLIAADDRSAWPAGGGAQDSNYYVTKAEGDLDTRWTLF